MAAAIGTAKSDSCVNGDHWRRALLELGLGDGHRSRAADPGRGTLRRDVRAWRLRDVQIQLMRKK